MIPTTVFGDYLTNLAAELSAHVLAAVPAWLQATWQGDETDNAVRRCLDAGIAAFVRRASADAEAYAELWELIFPRFFQDEAVAAQTVRLLEGENLNHRALQFMAASAGYTPERFPELNFAAALQEFEGAFLTQATHETTLQGVIQATQLLAQTRLQAETQAILTQIVELLQEISLKEINGISANTITATNVVNGKQIIYQLVPQAASSFPDHWESHYLQALLTQCDRLDLTTLAASEATNEAPSIAAVFTTLYLENVARTERETVRDALSPKTEPAHSEVMERSGGVRIEEKRYPITATEAIAAMPRLVILGQPGGGKSTLVNYLAAQLARQRLGEALATPFHWPGEPTPLPVRIVLRRFAEWLAAEKRNGTAGDVWDYLAFLLGRWGCADSFQGLRHTLIETGGIIFFDGLDEIRSPDTRQAIIKGAVTDFANIEKQCQIIITSRPYAYTDKARWRLPEDSFPVVTLAPFADEQIKAFNEAWYTRIMGPRRGWTREQCQRRANALTQTIQALPHLRRLAASPLLLTLMAQVHGQGGTLPDNRADLYRQTVDLLLSRWENRIVLDARPGEEIPADDVLWLGVSTGHLRDVLAQVAYRAHQRQGARLSPRETSDAAAEISRDELKLALVERFDSGEKAEQIMTYIQHRAGLLLAQAEMVYTFPHRTFQEFLAARHLLNQSDWSTRLRDHVRQAPDWWREVYLLSAGIATVPDIILQLVERLLPFEPGSDHMPLTAASATWTAIAAQALVETEFHYHVAQESEPGSFTAVYQRVQRWLKAIMVADQILPAKVRAEAGRWLARLGDDRPGVGIDPATGLPDIIWSAEIPAGTYAIGDDKGSRDEKSREVTIERPFCLARYPITNVQFQAFVEAEDWDDRRWWQGLPDDQKQFSELSWSYANHPRGTVSWYQAIAFCRWLTAKLHAGKLPVGPLTGDLQQYTITLPHEYEWEVAARWPNAAVQERIYPWGLAFDAAKANTTEGDSIGGTTAVGLYPSGKNEALDLYDLSGNVWEWCRNRYNKPESDMDPTGVDMGRDSRVLRGGSWLDPRDLARAASRSLLIGANGSPYGFRVVLVVVRPLSHHPAH